MVSWGFSTAQELFQLCTGGGDGIRNEVLECLEAEVFIAAVQRLVAIKKEKIYKGLVAAFCHISRWAASQSIARLELLRRSNGISALTHLVNELANADGYVHDSIQLEDLQVAAYEALGWLCGNESSSHAVASEVIQAQSPACATALEAAIDRFPDNRRSKVIGLAALSWCLRTASEAGEERGEGEARAEVVRSILHNLEESSNSDLQATATLCFGWVSFSHPATGLALLENKGIEHLVSAMQRHPLNRRLQYYACGTISHIITAHRKIAVSLVIAAGGVETMVAASRLHSSDWALQIAVRHQYLHFLYQ